MGLGSCFKQQELHAEPVREISCKLKPRKQNDLTYCMELLDGTQLDVERHLCEVMISVLGYLILSYSFWKVEWNMLKDPREHVGVVEQQAARSAYDVGP